MISAVHNAATSVADGGSTNERWRDDSFRFDWKGLRGGYNLLLVGSVRRGADALLGDGCGSPSEEACVVQNAVAVAEDPTRSFV
jgi:hypothetical protein